MATRTHTHCQSWHFEIQREDGDDWPERRDCPYTTIGRQYRPQRVRIEFRKQGEGPVTRQPLMVYGPRYVKAGPVGSVVDEKFWSFKELPGWLEKLVSDCERAIKFMDYGAYLP